MRLYQIMFCLFLNFKDEQQKLSYRIDAFLSNCLEACIYYYLIGIQKESKIPGTQNESKQNVNIGQPKTVQKNICTLFLPFYIQIVDRYI